MQQKKKRRGKPKRNIIGYLDKNARITANRHGFVIELRQENDMWVGKFFYSFISDTIRGYAKYLLRTKRKKVNKDFIVLLDAVTSLEETVKTVGEQLENAWKIRLEDPVERALVGDV